MRYYLYALVGVLWVLGACATGMQTSQDTTLGATASSAVSRFDGTWDVTLGCPQQRGAAGYSLQFVAQVANGILHGQQGTNGVAPSLELDGKIKPDGSAFLSVNGIANDPKFSTSSSATRMNVSTYTYHIDASFTESRGSGKRIEGRSCTLTLVKR